MKKASADMWWIIIGAVIALVVLIILLVLFTGKTGKLEVGLLSCEGKAGTCGTLTECQQKGGSISTAFECPQGQQCCFSSTSFKKGPGEQCTSGSECQSGYCSSNQYSGQPGECA